MKILHLLSVITFTSLSVFTGKAQVGIGTANPHSSSVLELNSNSKGVLIPRMTNAQRESIENPAPGLLVYCTDSFSSFYYYDGTQWLSLVNEQNTGNGANFINFNSTTPISVSSLSNNVIGNTSLIGNGVSLPGATILGNNLSLSAEQASVAFTIPRNSYIKSIYFNFYNNASLSLLGTTTLRLQIYKANADSLSFTPVTNATTTISITSTLSVGSALQSKITGLNLPIGAGEKLVGLITAQSAIASTVSGFATASILFD